MTAAQSPRTIARGPFQPTWESLVQNYRVLEWFRDAKFGIRAHWSAQCVPEQGDWYARRMYQQGDAAYGYDAEAPNAGVRYDAAPLTKADGKGTWWEGLNPQDLYTGRNLVVSDGITGIKAMNEWHNKNDLVWKENPPPMNPAFTEKWFLRCQDLVDK